MTIEPTQKRIDYFISIARAFKWGSFKSYPRQLDQPKKDQSLSLIVCLSKDKVVSSHNS
jgi:hypothetical protein